MKQASADRRVHLIDVETSEPVREAAVEVRPGVHRLAASAGRPAAPVPAGAADGVLVEPLHRDGELYLLIAAPDGRTVRVNGELDLGLACLRPGDVVQVGGRVLHVAEHVRSDIGTAPASHAAEACPVCQQPVGGDVVYLCPDCGAATHCDRDGAGHHCLMGRSCPRCRGAVVTEGYRHGPEAAA